MGLDTSHDCWHGSYGSFNTWRTKVCEVAGYGNLRDRHGFGGDLEWPEEDALTILLYHSDCDGEIDWMDCKLIADRLESLLPAMSVADSNNDYARYACRTRQFISGLKAAYKAKEDVEFH